MEKKHKLILDSDFSLIVDFFKGLDRQGPGSEAVTRLALLLCGELPADAHIADIGCGTGGQTITLARSTTGTIIASDLLPGFTEILRQKITALGLSERITVIEASMDKLPFGEGEFDLIWAEGSIYNIGYERGLNLWRRFLKPGGILAVSEVSWLTDSRPAEIENFWNQNYPQIDTIPNKIAQMNKAGYVPVAHFAQAEQCWWNYFRPIEAHYEDFLREHEQSEPARELVEHFREEVALYEKYSQYYTYVFYIGQLPDHSNEYSQVRLKEYASTAESCLTAIFDGNSQGKVSEDRCFCKRENSDENLFVPSPANTENPYEDVGNVFNIRPETEADQDKIYDLIHTAFKTAKVKDGDEQDYAVKLRNGKGYIPELALVAERDGMLVGHIMLTKTCIHQTDGSCYEALLVAPLSVLLEYRSRGVGSALMREGLRRAKEMGYQAAFLCGDPDYYGRFGFVSTSHFEIRPAEDIPPQYVLGIELETGSLDSVSGRLECC